MRTTRHQPLLHRGSTGPKVQKVEQRLEDLGYLKGPADDHFDARTAKAVVAYKKDHGWKGEPHGVVGDRALRSLGLEKKPHTSQPTPPTGGKTPSKLKGATYNVERDRKPKQVKQFLTQFTKSHKLDFVQVQEISGYHDALESIPGYHLITFNKAKDHGESGILVRDGLLQSGASYLQPKGGWITVRGGHAAPRSPVMVKLAGWLEVASVHQPPSVNWKNGHMVGPQRRQDTYRYTSEALLKFAKQEATQHPDDALLIGGDWNEPASTHGTYSPAWIARQAGMKTHGGVKSHGNGRIDWELARGAKVTDMKAGPTGGSDHRIVTFTVSKPKAKKA